MEEEEVVCDVTVCVSVRAYLMHMRAHTHCDSRHTAEKLCPKKRMPVTVSRIESW